MLYQLLKILLRWVENGFRFGRVTTSLPESSKILFVKVENGFRFGRVTTEVLLRCSWYDSQLKMASDSEGLRLITWLSATNSAGLKMASDSEGLRQGPLLSLSEFGMLKMASDSEGLRQCHQLRWWHTLDVENGFRFGRVTTLGEGAHWSSFWTCWKWLPIRKGYDNYCWIFFCDCCLLKMASDSEGLRPNACPSSYLPNFRWKWLPIRKGYDDAQIRISLNNSVENGFRFGRVTTIFPAAATSAGIVLLKMASDSEGLRLVWDMMPPPQEVLKMASDSEGLRHSVPP